MSFGSPFADITVQGKDVTVQVNGEWFELVSLNGVPASKIAQVAAALDDRDDAVAMLKRNIGGVMDALDSRLGETVEAVVSKAGEQQTLTLTCSTQEVENLEAKLEGAKLAFSGIIQLAHALGAGDKEITTAFMLAATEGPDMNDNPMAAMAAQMGAAAMGGGGQQQCTQQ
jgi:hypothetical protein